MSAGVKTTKPYAASMSSCDHLVVEATMPTSFTFTRSRAGAV